MAGDGGPITDTRIKLKDGRRLAFAEWGGRMKFLESRTRTFNEGWSTRAPSKTATRQRTP